MLVEHRQSKLRASIDSHTRRLWYVTHLTCKCNSPPGNNKTSYESIWSHGVLSNIYNFSFIFI